MGLANDVRKIVSKYEPPRIGVIGGSYVSESNARLCRRIGGSLRDFIGRRGWLFSGGVSGAGFEVYRGIADYSSQHRVSDRFFTLLPRGDEPYEYTDLARKLLKKEVTNEACGSSMEQRRRAMSMVGNVLIVVEGGGGTEDEALNAVENGTPLISFYKSGGAAGEYSEKSELVHPVADINEMLATLSTVTKRSANSSLD